MGRDDGGRPGALVRCSAVRLRDHTPRNRELVAATGDRDALWLVVSGWRADGDQYQRALTDLRADGYRPTERYDEHCAVSLYGFER
ncbi:hypothetical protein [Halosimplex salinum]|uniref:hypothetical protein n=1 Tax=Halosimplex salinum TaxID=1710538 RepID=UPI0013DE0CBB|nr:hypothetical protein [Halosimplex salinum]